jgi:hypothetical protein
VLYRRVNLIRLLITEMSVFHGLLGQNYPGVRLGTWTTLHYFPIDEWLNTISDHPSSVQCVGLIARAAHICTYLDRARDVLMEGAFFVIDISNGLLRFERAHCGSVPGKRESTLYREK